VTRRPVLITMDSSGWVEIFVRGPRTDYLNQRLAEAEGIIVPTMVLYEVYKYVRREGSEDEADQWPRLCGRM